MKYKKELIFICLIICLFSVASVCASDVNDTAINSDNTDQVIEETNIDDNLAIGEDDAIAQADNNEIISEKDDGTFTALQNKINNAKKGSTITLENDYTYDEGFNTDGIKIEKDLTIIGNGHTLNGLSKSAIFYISGPIGSSGFISLNNINFINGKNDAVAVHVSADITNCVFSNNERAIYTAEGTLNIHDCVFKDNNKDSESGGGAIYGLGDPRWHRSPVINLKNCEFTNNNAKWHGGAIHISEANLYVQDCVFTNNAGFCGGAICCQIFDEGSATITNCVFTNNNANSDGGAISCMGDEGSPSIINCIFTNNKAKGYGGAIDGQGSDENGVVKSCIFDNNEGKLGDVVSIKTIDCVFKKTVLTASKVTATYGVSKNLVVTLKDSNGQALNSKKVTITVGTISRTLTTNSNGQVSLDVSKLTPKTYTATVTYNGDSNHYKSTKLVKVTVKKANPKLIASAKAYKVRAVKKFTVALKTNRNVVMRNTLVTIKVGKITLNARTNAKGVATFNLAKLNKKGNYKTVITYKGNNYYNKATRTVYIRIV